MGHTSSNARPAFSLAILTAALLLSLTSFGVFMNDEGGQLEGLRALREGSWEIQEDAPHFYAVANNTLVPDIWDNTHNGKPFVTLVSMPAYYVLWALNFVIAPPTLLLLTWAGATYASVRMGWSRWYEWRQPKAWSWYNKPAIEGKLHERLLHRVKTMNLPHWVLVSVIGVWTLIQYIQHTPVDYSLWGEVFAIQTTHIVLCSIAAALFHDLVRRETDSGRAAAVAFTGYLMSPILFWSMGIKYHASSIFLVVLALWLYGHPRWRLWAFPIAAIAIMSTVLTAPVLVALVTVEAIQWVRLVRRDGFRALRSKVPVVATLTGGAAAVLAYNKAVIGNWFGRHGPSDAALQEAGISGLLGSLLDWMETASRFESWSQSFSNFWKLLFYSNGMEEDPLAFIGLAPLVVMAIFVPYVLWKRKEWSAMAMVCIVHTIVFFAAFIHGAHAQGAAILDHRFFVTAIPPLLLLAAIAMRDRIEAWDRDVLLQPAKAFGWGLVFVLPILLFLGSNEIALDPAKRTHQLVRASWAIAVVGTATMLGTTFFRDRIGALKADRWWRYAFGYSLISPAIFVFMMTILVVRQLPPWPFESGGETFTFLMPTWEDVRMWWGPKLIP